MLLGFLLVTGCTPNLDAANEPQAGGPSPTMGWSMSQPTKVSSSASAAPKATKSSSSVAPAPSKHGAPQPTALATDTAGGSAKAVGVPTSYAEASMRLSALKSAPHRALGRFTTPGDVVYCVLKSSSIPTSCELSKGAVRDPKVCGQSMADAVGRVQLGDAGGSPQCNSDTIREPGATVVAPPAVVTGGAIECAVEKLGVTCVNTHTNGGFFITPGRYATFSH